MSPGAFYPAAMRATGGEPEPAVLPAGSREAAELGEDWNQKKISLLEQKESIEPELLEQVAKHLKVPADAIKNFDEEVAINIISNTFNEAAIIHSAGTFNINPIDKWLQALEENKALYERLLQAEKDKVVLLEKMLEK